MNTILIICAVIIVWINVRKSRTRAADEWVTIRVDASPHGNEDWITMGKWVEVAGSHYRKRATSRLVWAAKKGLKINVQLVREPNNKHDTNAVKVFVKWPLGRRRFIGYLPRGTAQSLSGYPIDMPITGSLKTIRTNNVKTFVVIAVHIPSKSRRLVYGWVKPETAARNLGAQNDS